MTDTPRPASVEPVKCEVCLKEVPASEAKSAEANDYVMHFCGLECYQQWQQQEEDQE